MIKKILFFFMLSCLSYSQTLKITIKDEQGELIPVANILLKEKATNAILEFTKVTQGNTTYPVTKSYTTLVFEILSTNYVSQEIEIENPLKDKSYDYQVVLKNKSVELKEVVIEGKIAPYTIKKDTVVFDVSKYRDGSEKKVEDLIKKLPGVEVDANGSIKYKGKSIETVTLDGDNLFNSNYKIGTKNINIDMVEQIEAIDNYTNNKLLKGIESEGKVALNLKLKKGKSDFSGSLENALGLKNDNRGAFYSNSYLMQISSRIKSFTTINLNNIGRSDAYFYEKQSSKSLDSKSDEDFETKKVLSADFFSPQLDPVRTNRNSQFFASHNNLYKISKKITLKMNLNFIDDKINSKQEIETKNFINNTIIETNDAYSFIKKPKVFTGEAELRVNTSKTTLLEIYSKQYLERTKLFSDYTKNNSIGYNNINETNSYFTINKLVHTWKIADNKALQGNVYYTVNAVPQLFNSVSPTETINQNSEFKKTVFLVNYNLIGKHKNTSYTIQIGGAKERTPYFSKNYLVQNNSLFLNNTLYNHSRLKFNFKKFIFSTGISVTNYDFKLKNENAVSTLKLNKFLIEPNVDFNYKFGKSSITTSYSYSQKPINEEYIFSESVFVNNRTTIANIPSFDFKKTSSFGLSYFYNNLFKNTTLNVSSRFEKSNGQYLSDFNIDEDFITIKNSFYNVDNSSFTNDIRYSNFIEKLSSTIVFSSTFIENKYPNFVNSSDIRKNTNQIFKNSLQIRTGFDFKVNFEQSLTHNYVFSKSVISNQIESLQNSFKVRYKLNKKIKASIKWDAFYPNLNDKVNNYNFLDYELTYKLNDNLNFIFIASNLLNVKSFNQVENNDFSVFSSKTNLTERMVLLYVEYTF